MIVLPKPSPEYEMGWANQYTRVLELQFSATFNELQGLQQFIAPSYTTTSKNLLANKAGQIIFDTTLGKLCVNTGSGWETITSV